MAFMTEKTDDKGNFIFPPMVFPDTAVIHFQAKREAGGLSTEIMVEPFFKQGPTPGAFVSVLKELPAANNELAGLKYQLYNDNRKKNPKSKVTRNKAEQPVNDGHFRLYQDADAVLEIGNAGESYDNVLDFMTGKVTGVDINGNEVRIRGTGSFSGDATPLFLVDGNKQ
jgi:hypothetical protein